MIFGYEPPARRNFTITTKRIEWMDAAGKNIGQFLRDKKFVKTSYCRKCRTKLTWGDGSYNFDHKDNNSKNNSQKNCYLVCRNCHGKATKIDKIAVRGGLFGEITDYKTIKRKVSYKKPKTTATKKKVTKKKVTKRAPKKVTNRAKKSTSVKKARVKRSRKKL
jgi:hypothetical protein